MMDRRLIWAAQSTLRLLPPAPAIPQIVKPVFGASGADAAETLVHEPAEQQAAYGKVGRNQPCPCGSGKKYKHCHGAAA